MANLNFQQPPRSLSNQGLSRGGFGSSSLSGHVTPTSGIFPSGGGGGGGNSGGGSGSVGSGGGSTSSSSFVPQQLSPNRGLMGNRALFGHRGGFPERRQVGLSSVLSDWSSSSMGSMANFGMASAQSRNYGGSQGLGANFHSVFSASGSGGAGTGDSSTPPLLDMSEFPSLTNRGGQNDSLPQSGTLPAGKQPYGVCVRSEMRWMGMVKQPMSESSEFTMSSEDFPALPGTSSDGSSTNSAGAVGVVGSGSSENGSGSGGVSSSGVVSIGGNSSSSGGATVINSGGGAPGPVGSGIDKLSSLSGDDRGSTVGGDSNTTNNIGAVGSSRSVLSHESASSKQAVKKGIQTSPDGKVTNIPNSMVKDQFGMVGLLTFIRAAETDPNLVSLALGQDLTALGLNLNSPDNLYPTFAGPWAETPCRAQDIDYNVPPEYIINHNIRDKLATLKLTRYKEDLLFFMYYTNSGDLLQLVAAAELYSREWRYHIEEKVWITQAPGCSVVEKTSTYERGTYFFFDAQNWRKVAKEFYLDYSKLENQPNIPATYHAVV